VVEANFGNKVPTYEGLPAYAEATADILSYAKAIRIKKWKTLISKDISTASCCSVALLL
jgi:hypothetical protein